MIQIPFERVKTFWKEEEMLVTLNVFKSYLFSNKKVSILTLDCEGKNHYQAKVILTNFNDTNIEGSIVATLAQN